MRSTTVKEIMTANPVIISPETSLKDASIKMIAIDCGILPVGTKDNITGIITDRDIVIRAVANGKDTSKEKVVNYMTRVLYTCGENDSLEEAADLMRENNVSRLIVTNGSGAVTGILTFGHILRNDANPLEVSKVVQHATRVRAGARPM
ncbi:CBS domain-containing protein [Micavibrio aeruginosavorus]|nr:CBS domain-containing protein [Micavibrio aeruginosavorus]